MSWRKEIEELKRRGKLAERMGGAEKVERQHSRGKLDVRQRIEALLDKGSFREIGKIAGKAVYDADNDLTDLQASNFVTGIGRINGRPVVVGADDFTVRGGASDASIPGKRTIAERIACEMRMPMVRLLDGTGGGGSIRSLEEYGRTYVPSNHGWEHVVTNLYTVPTVSLALGPVAGVGAARCVSSHYTVMVRGLSQLFVAGPPVVNALGENVDKEGLGGSSIHTRNGAIDDEVDSEQAAFDAARRFLTYFPQSVFELPPRGPQEDEVNRREDFLVDIVPRERRKVYKMRKIIEAIVDNGSFTEIGRNWGRPAITGLARLDGWPVALMAGDPYHYGGAWTADASQKAIRFIELAETFHLPVVNLVDCPGFLVGIDGEKTATIRHGARAMATVFQATVPWCTVIIRKSFGVAGAAQSNSSRLQYRFAWPSGDWGSLPVEGGIEVAYQSELAVAEDPQKRLEEIQINMEKLRSPFRTAEAFLVEDIIDPRETRPLLCEFANLAAPLRQPGLSVFRARG
jgi:acetyl-CoA carboxylase carboxyltransferase component